MATHGAVFPEVGGLGGGHLEAVDRRVAADGDDEEERPPGVMGIAGAWRRVGPFTGPRNAEELDAVLCRDLDVRSRLAGRRRVAAAARTC